MPISAVPSPVAAGESAAMPRPFIWTNTEISGQTIWRWLAVAYGLYWVCFIAGAYTDRQELNNAGAVFILAALGWAALERLRVKLDSVAIACTAAALLPLLVALATHATRYPDAMVKHISLYVVMAISRILVLPAISETRVRGIFATQIAIVLVLSFITDHGGVWDAGTRHSGLFANPNNLALIPLLLLFLTRRSDPRWIQFAAPAAVVAVLAITRTSGSIIACGVGLSVHLWSFLPRRSRPFAATLLGMLGVVLAVFALFGGERLLPESRLTNQIAVMRADLSSVLEGDQISLYHEERTLGPGTASGVWRLEHWRRIALAWFGGTAAQQLAGFGIGSSPDFFGKLPHNEYLRVLFEQGIVGFSLFLFAWTRLIRTAPKGVRYCGLILAIYSFSENNLDNFPFMSLFILFLSAGTTLTEHRRTKLSLVRAAVAGEDFA
ncbi:MAG TPA: O-antigen ligase family protein [Bryobacteraceae bacterium]|nr:O-antigen ligase family protein [Bryobacteraceae bacterium]